MGRVSKISALAALALVSISGAQAAERFVIDQTHSNFAFMVNHLGYSNMIGRFTQFSGEFTFDEKDLAANQVKISIDTKSIDTNHQRRDDHLRSPDFFNVAEFPAMTFQSTKVEKTGEKTGKLTGNLTLLGVTKAVTFDVTFNKMAPHPLPQYKQVLTAGFSGRGTIKRTDFGMKYAAPALGDEIQILVEIEGQKP
jgi:polyisoprenoid-binding protein YceI